MSWSKFGRSIGLAGVIGFAAFLFSGHGLSWVLAAGIFYYDFVVREDLGKRSRRKG